MPEVCGRHAYRKSAIRYGEALLIQNGELIYCALPSCAARLEGYITADRRPSQAEKARFPGHCWLRLA